MKKLKTLYTLFLMTFIIIPAISHATYSIIAVDTTTHRTGVALGTCIIDTKNNIVPMVLQNDTSYISDNGIFQAQGLIYNQQYIIKSAKEMMDRGTTGPLMIDTLVNDAQIEYTDERQYTAIIKDGVQISPQSYNGEKLIGNYDSSFNTVGNINFFVAGNRLANGSVDFLKNTFSSTRGGVEEKLVGTLDAMSKQSFYGDNECLKNEGKGTTNAYIKVLSGDNTRSSELITSANFEYTSSSRSDDAVEQLLKIYNAHRKTSDYVDNVTLLNGQSYTTSAYAKNDSSVYFTAPYALNRGSITNAPQGQESNTSGHTVIEAIARHKTMLGMPIKLRASNIDSSGKLYTMNSSTFSLGGLAGGRLRIEFHDEDNKTLPSGEYFIGLTIFANTETDTGGDIQRLYIPLTIKINNEVITLGGKVAGTFSAGSRSWSDTYKKADEICTNTRQLDSSINDTFGLMKFKALLSNRADVVKSSVTYRRGGPWGDGINTVINKNASNTGHELAFNSSQEGTITPWGERAWWGTQDHHWDCDMWSQNYGGWVGANMDAGQKGINSVDREWCDNINYLVCVSTDEAK